MRPVRRWGLVVFLLVACVWLNQSVTEPAWKRAQQRVFVTHEASWLETLRYPFVFLYRRSGDERLYHATALALRGQEPDREFWRTARRRSGPDFARELPPPDGQYHAPYTEVPFEYPPLALPFVLAPSYVSTEVQAYCVTFGVTMGLCLALAAWLVQKQRGWWLSTLALLLHGAIAVQRLDAAVALALALAYHAWTRGHLGRLGAALGVAAALKLTPLVLLLPASEREGRPPRLWLAALGVTAVGIGAFYLFGPDAFGTFWRYHAGRGLHVESVPATLLVLVRAPFAPVGPALLGHGSFNLEGPSATLVGWLATAATPFGALVLARRAKGRAPLGLLVAGLCVVWLTGKVFSPQYLTWLLPFFGLLPARSRAGRFDGARLYAALALGLSQLYLRAYFDAVYNVAWLGVGTLLLRDLAVVGLLVRALELRDPAADRSAETASPRRETT